MKILLLSRYGRLGSSSRLRSYQYIDFLRSRGIELVPAPLFDDNYVRNLYAGRRKSPVSVVVSYTRRLTRLLSSTRFDLVWLEGELFPFLPAWGEEMLSRTGLPYIVDYDDALFHRYDQSRNPLVRAALGDKIDKVMRKARMVLAGNEYIAEHARNIGAKNVVKFPTVIDLERYEVSRLAEGRPFTIGWIGSPVTAKYLLLINNALKAISKETDTRLILVGAGDFKLPGLAHRSRQWSEETEAAEIADFDVGIMPLPDEPWERGKCGYKLIQYMASSKPVVASPVGENTRIVAEGIEGLLATDESEWLAALLALADDSSLRERMGNAGRKKVENKYCVQVAAPRLVSLFNSL